ncbi:hypothetical protein P9112_011115 [Eukaryota sp. TZLM1-RC]
MPPKRSNAARRRDINKQLRNPDLPSDLKSQLEQELRQLEQCRIDARRQELERKNSLAFKKVRHIEKRKILRKLEQLEKRFKLNVPTDATEEESSKLTNELHDYKQKLSYVTHFPMIYDYISILKTPSSKEALEKRAVILDFCVKKEQLINQGKNDEAIVLYKALDLPVDIDKPIVVRKKEKKSKSHVTGDNVRTDSATNDSDSAPEELQNVATTDQTKSEGGKNDSNQTAKRKEKVLFVDDSPNSAGDFSGDDFFAHQTSENIDTNWKKAEVREVMKLAVNKSYLREEERAVLRANRQERKSRKGENDRPFKSKRSQ